MHHQIHHPRPPGPLYLQLAERHGRNLELAVEKIRDQNDVMFDLRICAGANKVTTRRLFSDIDELEVAAGLLLMGA